jgi:hypothetical protein
VQVPYGAGVATHIGSEPCAIARKGEGEASVGECTGQPLNRERPIIPGADTVPNVEGHTHGRAICERPDDSAWSQTLACAEASCMGTGRSHGRPAALITRAAPVRIGKARSRTAQERGRKGLLVAHLRSHGRRPPRPVIEGRQNNCKCSTS